MATVKQLRQQAKDLNLKNYSRMTKTQLEGAIESNLAVVPNNEEAETKFKNWVLAMSITAMGCMVMAAVAISYWYWVIRPDTMWERLLGMIGL